MHMHHPATAAVLLAALPALADPIATDTFATGADKSVFVPTGEASGVLNFLFEFAPLQSDDPADPLAGAQGPCWGLGKMAAGITAGDGYCDFADPSGDHAVMHWSMEPTVEVRGAWQFVGGTGKWAHAVGGGYFFDTTPDDGAPVTHFVGRVEFE